MSFLFYHTPRFSQRRRRCRRRGGTTVGVGVLSRPRGFAAMAALFLVTTVTMVFHHQVVVDAQQQVVSLIDPSTIYLAGLMDLGSYPWASDIMECTVQQINNDYFSVFDRSSISSSTTKQTVQVLVKDSQCSENKAVQGYWDIRQDVLGGRPPDGIVGARCSGASVTVARISGLEGVPQVSPASNSATLSNADEFPYFSRLVAPNDERGEVGALITLLRSFGWDRIMILATDTQYAKDLVEEFRKNWVGEQFDGSTGEGQRQRSWTGSIAYSDTIRTLPDTGLVDEDSVNQVLDGIPTDDPRQTARVILLAAHNQHAYDILHSFPTTYIFSSVAAFFPLTCSISTFTQRVLGEGQQMKS